MMNQLEFFFAMFSPTHKKGADLPEIVIEMNPEPSLFPIQDEFRQIKEDPMYILERIPSELLLDDFLVVRPCYYPYLIEARDLLHPVPSNAGFRSLVGFARVS
jgi:hypothetical protein